MSSQELLKKNREDFKRDHLYLKIGTGHVLENIRFFKNLIEARQNENRTLAVVECIGLQVCQQVANFDKELLSLDFGYNNWHKLGYSVVAMVWEQLCNVQVQMEWSR